MKKMNRKLLFIGSSNDTKCALDYCKKMGVYTIVTDYIPYENSFAKQNADEYWMIDIKDIDELEKKCLENKINGVYAGNSELCLDYTRLLAKKLNLPFYASNEGWEAARNKAFFKECCEKEGLDVPHSYDISKILNNNLSQINYPLIVKPADSCASRGLSVVKNYRELLTAYDKAKNYSQTNKILVEDYIDGDEFEPIYYIVNGTPHLIGLYNMYKTEINGRQNHIFVTNSPYLKEFYLNNIDKKIRKLLKQLNCKDGMVFVQMIYKDKKCYLLEFGYRIDGVGWWEVMEKSLGFNAVKMAINYALKTDYYYKFNDYDRMLDKYKNVYGIYFYWANPGKVSTIVGLDKLKEEDGYYIIMNRYKAGDIIKKSDDMCQMAFYIGICALSKNEFINKVAYVNDTLKIIDDTGKDLTIKYNNCVEIWKD